MNLPNSKKGFAVGDLMPLGMTFVVLGISLAIGSKVLSDTRADFVTNSYHCGWNSTNGTGGTLLYDNCGADYNATSNSLTSVGTITSWLPTIALVVVAAVIIGILVVYLMRRFT